MNDRERLENKNENVHLTKNKTSIFFFLDVFYLRYETLKRFYLATYKLDIYAEYGTMECLMCQTNKLLIYCSIIYLILLI
jgi:hypothetical protein